MTYAALESVSSEAKHVAVDELLRESGDVFVTAPDGSIAAEQGEQVADTLRGEYDGAVPDQPESVELVYEDENKYNIAVDAGDSQYEIRGGYPRTLFEQELSSEEYWTETDDGTHSAYHAAKQLRS